ncbi:MAG: hypothetical protein DBX56_00510 [Coriobacteriia bacterium]|nr:MAG: hypothetical protein DBX56_00510 [Coriobacteriia bacterium]
MFRTIIAHFSATKFVAGARRKTPSDEHKMRQLSRMKASWASLLAPHVALGARGLSFQGRAPYKKWGRELAPTPFQLIH